MKYKPSRDIPKYIKELKTFSPSILRAKILEERNKAITPESITMWLSRNPKVLKSLKDEIIGQEIDNEEVNESIFHNGTFEQLKSVAKWNLDMRRRKIANRKTYLSGFKNLCRGYFPKWNVKIPDWNFKHPDRFTQETMLEIVDHLDLEGKDSSYYRLMARNFLMSCNKPYNDISGEKSTGFGKHADLYVDKEILGGILRYIKNKSYLAYVVDLFMFKTATRITATLKAKIEDMGEVEGINQVIVYDKGRRSKNPQGKKWTKFIPNDLYEHLKIVIGDRRKGPIFEGISKVEMSQLNREALKFFVPEVEKDVRMINHFWRHMFAQHMLRATNWKYGVVANLGGWTVKALEESYGKPPLATVREWGLEYIPQI